MINEERSRPIPRPFAATSKRSPDAIAAKVVFILRSVEERGVVLIQQLDETLDTEGWTEWVAEKVLAGIETEASHDANELFQFAKDHPLATAGLLTIIAVGVLVLLAPTIVVALGSFAAWWESTYAGYIPAGSLFSFLQRLGMIWGRA
ncbi:hypothetical protein M406DRAFT_339775 [Cryphonectria parasitica EP155]|uniref:Uncharacterized protein n=1 Tax=Cryphonectria parasitica (strain ATCC 38755 / EP155) TaxID=660469 RepID=A0A9P4Y5A3_CRYP1|nr:uncharacterized protein M406DRAFT_339775 [Cryphonectria parasitica EP155]KAF3766617.1 hypothetical protein M406DRAFT_339775 [Cryphonectria parasitica EP155]